MTWASLRLALKQSSTRWVPLLRGVGLLLLAWVCVDVALHSSLESPEPTFLLQDRTGTYMADLGGDALGFWPVESLPERVVQATRVLEDRRFHWHPGVDPLAIARAVWDNLRHLRRVSGASTLAMQVARLQRPGPRTAWKKGMEALTALALTARHGRTALLEQYLRIVPYGNRIHGIAYAARRYLDKPVEDLSDAEIAFLVSIPQSPAHMNPYTERGRARAIARGQRVLTLLGEEGLLTPVQLARARAELAALRFPLKPERPVTALHALLFAEALARQSSERPLQPLLRSTLDLELQREVVGQTRALVDALSAEGVGNAAVLVVERPGLQVRAYVGSTSYFDAARKGAIDYVQVPRLSGSILKPFLYAQALERRVLAPDTLLEDLARTPEGVDNLDHLYLGPLLPRAALANSRNVPAVEVLKRVGLESAYEQLRRLGILKDRFPASYYGMSLAVGGVPVTLWELLTATSVFLEDGSIHPLSLLKDLSTKNLESNLYSENTIRLINLYLSDPMARLPVFPRLGHTEFPFPVAVKTGTSSGYRDAWAVAYSARWLVGVWMGHPDTHPMKRVTGYQSAARLVHSILTHLHQDQSEGLSDLSFPPPRGWIGWKLCRLSGKVAGPLCDKTVLEYLPPERATPEACSVHRALWVDRRTGAAATPQTPRLRLERRTVVQLPPQFSEWQARAGLPFPPPTGLEVSTASSDPVDKGGTAAAGPAAGASGPLRLDRPIRLEVVTPRPGMRLVRDPEMPPFASTLPLKARAVPEVPELVWYVDGRPWALTEAPYQARWTLSPGIHTFQVGVPLTPLRSKAVTVRVE